MMHKQPVLSLAFSRDSEMLASGEGERGVSLMVICQQHRCSVHTAVTARSTYLVKVVDSPVIAIIRPRS